MKREGAKRRDRHKQRVLCFSRVETVEPVNTKRKRIRVLRRVLDEEKNAKKKKAGQEEK